MALSKRLKQNTSSQGATGESRFADLADEKLPEHSGLQSCRDHAPGNGFFLVDLIATDAALLPIYRSPSWR